MDKEQVRQYVFRYFLATGSHVLETGPGLLRVKLSETADKDLTNRPLYWAFVERSGMAPETMTMTFIFDREQTPADVEGEELRFGSPRLLQIFSSAAKHGRWTRLYEEPEAAVRKPVSAVPWLGVNCNVQYICDRKRDEIHSLGVNLLTGQLEERFMARLKDRPLSPRLPPRVHVAPAVLSLAQAVNIIQNRITAHVRAQDERWVRDARARMAEEMDRIRQYYENLPPKRQDGRDESDAASASGFDKRQAAYQKQLEETKWQYNPRVQVDVINAGLFFLQA